MPACLAVRVMNDCFDSVHLPLLYKVERIYYSCMINACTADRGQIFSKLLESAVCKN